MGQQVAVTRLPSRVGTLRFEANRNFTGMGHERFTSAADAVGDTPSAIVARQLFATGQVNAVHVYGNVITLGLAGGYEGADLDGVVADMYQYWTPGRPMPTFDDLPAEAAAAPAADTGAAGGAAGGADSAYVQRVPEALRQRSAAALARWRANH